MQNWSDERRKPYGCEEGWQPLWPWDFIEAQKPKTLDKLGQPTFRNCHKATQGPTIEHKICIVMKLTFLYYNTFTSSIHIFFSRFRIFSFLHHSLVQAEWADGSHLQFCHGISDSSFMTEVSLGQILPVLPLTKTWDVCLAQNLAVTRQCWLEVVAFTIGL